MRLTLVRKGIKYVLKVCKGCGDELFALPKQNRCSLCGDGLAKVVDSPAFRDEISRLNWEANRKLFAKLEVN